MAETNLTESVTKIVELVEKMSVAELSTLVTALKEKFGVTGAAFMPAAMPAAGAAAAGAAKEEEQVEFKLTLLSVGDGKKIPVLKELRASPAGADRGQGYLDKVPSVIKEGATKEEADKIARSWRRLGQKWR